MPTRVLGLDEAGEWLVMIAENEGVDHPVVSQMSMYSEEKLSNTKLKLTQKN
jgi:hypothetical protein